VNRERIARVLAPNPSPMTLEGTNTFVIDAGRGLGIVIDPGPAIPAHIERIAASAAARGLRIEAILVTHGHPDHAPGAAPLSALTGAPVYAHAAAGFPFDRPLAGGDLLRIGETSLAAHAAPGHAPDHLVFALEAARALFTGDVVVGRGTILIAPPGGDMRAYQATLARLRGLVREGDVIYGGHGDPIDAPLAKVAEYLRHREAREEAILAALTEQPSTIPELVARIYEETPRVLWGAAARQILAHLIALEREARVRGRQIERPLSALEDAILNPDLSELVDAESRAVARAELGVMERAVRLKAYERTP
jgi:glyoxylase-like metal-dependent hydrolase (beta-lactamase superfamily II)